MNHPLANTARIIFGVLIFIFGLNHFINGSKMIGVLEGWPAPSLWLYLSGLGLILAGLSFIINKYAYLAGILLAILLVIIVATIHIPGLIAAGMDQMMQFVPNILKDLTIASASLLIAGISKGNSQNTS